MSVKCLHIITDEKFTDFIINNHRLIDNDDIVNDFAIFVPVHNLIIRRKYKYIIKTKDVKIVTAFNFISYLKRNEYNAVFIHNLYSTPLMLIKKIPSNVKVFWFAWGRDIYCKPSSQPLIHINNLYKPKTLQFIHDTHPRVSIILELKRWYYKFNKLQLNPNQEIIEYYKAIERVDYFSGILANEYNLIKKFYNKFNAQPIIYKYSRLKVELPVVCKGNNIIVGNSTDKTNNHLDIIEILNGKTSDSQKIFFPLSYGATEKTYIDAIIASGVECFGKSFIPILNFMPCEQYISIFESCGFAIYYHERQQAMGNIYTAVASGCKVFLSDTSVAYEQLKEDGYIVYSIQDDLSEESLRESLSFEKKKYNRDLYYKRMSSIWNYDALKRIYSLI